MKTPGGGETGGLQVVVLVVVDLPAPVLLIRRQPPPSSMAWRRAALIDDESIIGKKPLQRFCHPEESNSHIRQASDKVNLPCWRAAGVTQLFGSLATAGLCRPLTNKVEALARMVLSFPSWKCGEVSEKREAAERNQKDELSNFSFSASNARAEVDGVD